MTTHLPMTPTLTRRAALLRGAGAVALAAPLLSACSGPPTRPDDAVAWRPTGPAVLQHWRTISTGQIAAPAGAFGVPSLPGLPSLPAPMGGAPIRLVGPVALALRGGSLLVADAGLGRLIRIEPNLPAWTVLPPVAGLAISPRTVVALGTDASLWALDGPSRMLLNLSAGGQVIRRVDLGAAGLGSPVGFALAGFGQRIVVADDSRGRWVELRGGLLVEPMPMPGDAATDPRSDAVDAVDATDAIAASTDRIYLLDRRRARVRVVALADGRSLQTLGEGELRQPVALAADARGRLAVLDAQDGSVHLHVPGQPVLRLGAAELRVRLPVALAMDDGWLAVADRSGGVVQLFRVLEGRAAEGLTR